MRFGYLRETEWNPSFEWVLDRAIAADKINIPHEDYPKYVMATEATIEDVENLMFRCSEITLKLLLHIHKSIFADKVFAGHWRELNVRVGPHHPPIYERVTRLMKALESLYSILSVEDLIEWYKDFETIHPFEDGNGRVGGVVIAAYSHNLRVRRGWLAPNQ